MQNSFSKGDFCSTNEANSTRAYTFERRSAYSFSFSSFDSSAMALGRGVATGGASAPTSWVVPLSPAFITTSSAEETVSLSSFASTY